MLRGGGGKEIVSLTGEMSMGLYLLEKADIIVCTPGQVSAQWFLKVL